MTLEQRRHFVLCHQEILMHVRLKIVINDIIIKVNLTYYANWGSSRCMMGPLCQEEQWTQACRFFNEEHLCHHPRRGRLQDSFFCQMMWETNRLSVIYLFSSSSKLQLLIVGPCTLCVLIELNMSFGDVDVLKSNYDGIESNDWQVVKKSKYLMPSKNNYPDQR